MVLVERTFFSGSFCSWRMDARTLALKLASPTQLRPSYDLRPNSPRQGGPNQMRTASPPRNTLMPILLAIDMIVAYR